LTTNSVDATSFLPQAANTTAATATDTTVKEREPENFIETPKNKFASIKQAVKILQKSAFVTQGKPKSR
jgi:hypothetical protein